MSVSLHTRVDRDVYDALCRVALKRQLSLSALVRLILTNGIAVLREPHPEK